MANEIIHLGNNLNKISWGDLTALEQNLLLEVLYRLAISPNCSIYLVKTELKAIFQRNMTDQDVLTVLVGLEKKFFSIHFESILDERLHRFVNLFRVMEFHETELFLNLEVDPLLRDQVKDVTRNFTRIELADFLSLQGKYSKTLYRLLMQWRSKGSWTVEINDLRNLLCIPASYKMCDIDRRIINPAVNELNWNNGQRDITKEATKSVYRFAEKPSFPGLKFKKNKEKGSRGRGGKVISITFEWSNSADLKEIADYKQAKQQQILPKRKKLQNSLGNPVAETQLQQVIDVDADVIQTSVQQSAEPTEQEIEKWQQLDHTALCVLAIEHNHEPAKLKVIKELLNKNRK